MNSSCLLRCLSSVALVAFVAVLSTAQEGLDDYDYAVFSPREGLDDYAVFSPREGQEFSLERGYANVDIAGLEVLQEPAELKLFPGDFLPDGPRSLTGATLAWTIADAFPVNQSWGNPANYANLNTTRVVTVPRDANRTDIHISSASSGYSLYTVRHKDSTQTDQPLITGLDGATAPSRWHTLTGATCPRPTTPGLYIEVRPDGTARKVLLTR